MTSAMRSMTWGNRSLRMDPEASMMSAISNLPEHPVNGYRIESFLKGIFTTRDNDQLRQKFLVADSFFNFAMHSSTF